MACGGPTTQTPPGSGGVSGAPSGTISTSPPSASSPSASPPGDSRYDVPADSTPVPAGQVDAAALPPRFPAEAYITNGGTVLYVRAIEGGCQHALAEVTEQTAQHVVVDLSQTKVPPGQLCTKDLRYPYLPVTLAAPLGDRTVVLTQSPPR
ncbi:hypothetical protein K1T34_48955 [Amycolatopsis sp. DSM 110486]|nr:hypothetical protein K1T34_48955 [Amycolatopsis sp. DSM 110486]